MEVKYRKYKNHYILDLIGELDLYNTETLFDAVNKISSRNIDSLILNMANVTYMDSSGVGALIKVHTEKSDTGRKFIITSISDNINKVFTTSGLIHFFSIENSVTDALKILLSSNVGEGTCEK